MLAAYTELKDAETVKQYLIKKDLLNRDYAPLRVLNEVFFPIIKTTKIPRAKIKNVKFTFTLKPERKTIETLLAKKLSTKELALVPRGLEIIGNILILEIPPELQPKETLIAQSYLDLLPQVETVVKKNRVHSGLYRIRGVKILAGKRTKETVHQENGVRIKLHLEKTYFSARSGSERLRIAKQVKKNERVLVMFSGAAPYLLAIAKNSTASQIYGIEINPLAHEYAVANLKLNNIKNAVVNRGDVRLIMPKLPGQFDRIVMPLPRTGEGFLDLALSKIKPNGIIHFYAFLHEREFNNYADKIKQICSQKGKIVRILRKVTCGNFSPGVFRICYDLKVKYTKSPSRQELSG